MSFCFLSLVAWFCFIGVSALSFVNLPLMDVLIYPRKLGNDSLLAKWVLIVVLMFLSIHFYNEIIVNTHIINNIVKALDRSFILYFIIGWPLYLAVIFKQISLDTYFLFTVAFNIPEKGSVYTFVLVTTQMVQGEMLAFYIIFLLFMRHHIKYVNVKFIVATVSIILTTTRAGIIPAFTITGLVLAYRFLVGAASFNPQCVRRKTVFRIALLLILLVAIGFLLPNVKFIVYRMQTLYHGIVYLTESESVQTRFILWNEAMDTFRRTAYLGDGFGKYLETHNLILQLLAEIGFAGTLFFLLFIILRILAVCAAYVQSSFGKSGIKADFIRMLLAALPANAFFALTNHNLFHFTFWFLVISTFIVEVQNVSQQLKSSYATADAE